MLEPFQLPYVQEGIAEILILSVASGLLGTWIVLRGLAFYAHAVGTAAFPGLVLADGLGFSATLGAFGSAVLFALAAAAIGRARRTGYDSVTALVLVGCLAGGVILASDVFGSGANVETLLFGSLLLIDGGDIFFAIATSGLALLATLALGHRWLAKGFDPESAAALGTRSPWLDAALLGLIALAATAALTAVGALLVTALLVVPAATARLLTSRVAALQVGTIVLAAAEGTAGMWLSVKTDAPPGATIAVISGAMFALALAWRALSGTRLKLAALGVVGAVLLIAGCGDSDGGGEGVEVVATTTQVADIVRQVGGDGVEVKGILQPNTDPHDYEPRPSDVTDVAEAAVVFRSGGDLDDWSEELISDSGSDAELVDLSAGLPGTLRGGHEAEDSGHAEEGGGGEEELDPHWWHDPRNVEAVVVRIERALAEAAPEARRAVAAGADGYLARLRALDRGIERCMAAVPARDRKLVTDHDAFGYFADRYRIEVVGAVIPAMTTQAQPSAGELAQLANVIRSEAVKAVFPESSVSSKLAEAIADDTGASAEYELYGDTLGPEGTSGATYLTMEQANADAMVRGFTGGSRVCSIRGIG